MLASTILATLALAASSLALPIRVARGAPADWWYEGLEPYDQYKSRFDTLGCAGQNGTYFYEYCCQPLLASQTFEQDFKPECKTVLNQLTVTYTLASETVTSETPSWTPSTSSETVTSASAAPSATQAELYEEEDCDEKDTDYETSSSWTASASSFTSSSAAPTATTTSTASAESSTASASTSAQETSGSSYSEQPASSSSSAAPTTTFSTEQPAPTSTSSTEQSAPTTTSSTEQPEPTTSSSTERAAATPAVEAADQSSEQFSGTATFYYTQTGNQGACGGWLSDSDFTVAMNTAQFDGSCNKNIVITNPDSGAKQTARVADACPGCGWGGLDLTPGLFQALVPSGLGKGIQNVEWTWA